MPRLDEAKGAGPRPHHDALGPCGIQAEADSLQEFSGCNAGGGEERVIPVDEVIEREDAIEVLDARLQRIPTFFLAPREQLGLHVSAQPLESTGRQDGFRRSSDPHEDVDSRMFLHRGGHGAGHVAVRDEFDPRSRGPHLLDQLFVARPVEDDNREVFHVLIAKSGDPYQVVLDGSIDVYGALGLGADGNLLHVGDVGAREHRSPPGHCHHRNRIGKTAGGQRRTVDGIDGEVDLGTVSVADVGADRDHRGLILLTFAEDGAAVHVHEGECVAYRVPRGPISRNLVSAAHPSRGPKRGGLGYSDQFHGQVPAQGPILGHLPFLRPQFRMSEMDRGMGAGRRRSSKFDRLPVDTELFRRDDALELIGGCLHPVLRIDDDVVIRVLLAELEASISRTSFKILDRLGTPATEACEQLLGAEGSKKYKNGLWEAALNLEGSLDIDFQQGVLSAIESVFDFGQRSPVTAPVHVGVLQQFVAFDHARELVIRDEVVILSGSLSKPRSACRTRHHVVDVETGGLYGPDDGVLSDAGRATENNQQRRGVRGRATLGISHRRKGLPPSSKVRLGIAFEPHGACMPFDIFTMAATRDELERTAIGTRVDKVIQPSRFAVALRLWGPGVSCSLLISADSRYSRVHATTDKLAKAFETPSPFVMLLRKYLTGSHIQAVRQVRLERVLMVDIATKPAGAVTLVTEVMGNRSNIILVDGAEKILGAIKLIGPRQSRVRHILPHVSYILPPPQSRPAIFGSEPKLDLLDTALTLDRLQAELAQAPADATIREALLGLLQGCSPSIATDIATRAGYSAAQSLSSVEKQALAEAIQDQFSLLRTRQWAPIVMYRDGDPVDYRAYDRPPVEGARPAVSMSAAVEIVNQGLESLDALKASRERLQREVDRRRSEVSARLASLARGLRTAEKTDELREAGNLILGYQYQIAPGSPALEIPEMDRTISLDPSLGAVENAEKYFKRYRKAREAGRRVPLLLEAAEKDLEFVDEIEMYVELAETPVDLVRLESELVTRFGAGAKAKKRPVGAGRPLTLDLASGVQILVGRSARQNEEVTFKLAGRGDLWLHARGVPGAHVVLRGVRFESLEDLETEAAVPIRWAASVAAYYSKARTEQAADVVVARVRDIHRVPGGAPGLVTLRGGSTIRVPPLSPEQATERYG